MIRQWLERIFDGDFDGPFGATRTHLVRSAGILVTLVLSVLALAACSRSADSAAGASAPPDGEAALASADVPTEAAADTPTVASEAISPAAKAEAAAAAAAADEAADEERRRLAELEQREQEARARETELARREEIAQREREVAERERALAERERRIAAQERAAPAEATVKPIESQPALPEPTPEPVAGQPSARELPTAERAVLVDAGDRNVVPGDDPSGTVEEERWQESWRTRGRSSDDREATGPAERIAALERLSAGAELELEIEDDLSSGTSTVGEVFQSRLTSDVLGPEGELIVPAGSVVWGRVVDVRPLRRVGGRATLELQFERLELPSGESVEVRASLLEQGRNKKKDKAKIVGGAIAGLILGRILGDGETAAAGAAVGAAAGTAAAISAEGREVELPAGTELSLVLEEVVTVTTRYGEPVRD
ncbi:MAG TPA: hypothetical protein VMT85_01745 [Thermoanaerobaculia bacterium]|nr:hypothetical protein [Thermoanaerobaculia bacterium]